MSKTYFSILFALLLAPLAALNAAAARQPKNTVPAQTEFITLPESYADLYRKILAKQSGVTRLSATERLGLSAIACRLALLTPTPDLRDQAVKLLEQTLSDPAFDLADGHNTRVFGEHIWLMKQNGLLTPGLRSQITLAVQKHFRSQIFQQYLRILPDPSGNNITHMYLYGYAGLLKYFADEELAERVVLAQALAAHCDSIFKTGDLDEDAANYDSLGLTLFIDIVRLLGREPELKASPGFRRLFDRIRDIVSPSGLIPEYGDAYFTYAACALDRVYLLEYATRLYDDPTYLHAARKLYQRPNSALPGNDIWSRALPLINLERSQAAPRVPTSVPSLVTYRRHFARTEDDLDKLILRTGREPGAAMIMVDIYARGSHAHPEKGPSVAYYEVGGVPLFHNLGRHGTRSSVTGNLLFALPAPEPFPGCFNQPDVWTTMAIPIDYLVATPTTPPQTEQAARAQPGHYLAGAFSLRNFPEYNHACAHLYFDNLRLSGPSGELLLDGFENATGPGLAGWSKAVLKEATAAADHTEGRFSQRLNWNKLKGGAVRIFPLQPTQSEQPIDERKYTHLKLDLKFTGQRPYMHIRGLGKQVDLGDQLLATTSKAAHVEQRGRDAFGEIEYAACYGDCQATGSVFWLRRHWFLLVLVSLCCSANATKRSLRAQPAIRT